MSKTTDIQVKEATLYFLPVETRVPLKFGPETLTYVTCARVCLRVEDAAGNSAEGWGETPLSVQWVWPSALPYGPRHEALKDFCGELVASDRGLLPKTTVRDQSHLKKIMPSYSILTERTIRSTCGSSRSKSSGGALKTRLQARVTPPAVWTRSFTSSPVRASLPA